MTTLPSDWAAGQGWEVSQWARAAWQVELEEAAAVDVAAHGDWHAPPRVFIDDDGDPTGLSAEQLYEIAAKDWPEVLPVIPADKFVTKHQSEEVRKALRIPNEDRVECFAMAQYQINPKEFTPSGNAYTDPETHLIQVERRDPAGKHKVLLPLPLSDQTEWKKFAPPVMVRTVHRPNEAVRGLLTIKAQLGAGIPLVLGVRLLGVARRPNDRLRRDIHPANHYVVAVASGRQLENNTPTIQYYDYLKDPKPEFRFRLTHDLRLLDSSNRREVVEVRTTKRISS